MPEFSYDNLGLTAEQIRMVKRKQTLPQVQQQARVNQLGPGPQVGQFSQAAQHRGSVPSQQIEDVQQEFAEQNQGFLGMGDFMQEYDDEVIAPPQGRATGGGWYAKPHWSQQLNYGLKKGIQSRKAMKYRQAQKDLEEKIAATGE